MSEGENNSVMRGFWENIFEQGSEGGSSTARKAMARADDPFERPFSITQKEWGHWALRSAPTSTLFHLTPRNQQKARERAAVYRMFPFEDSEKAGRLQSPEERANRCKQVLPANLAQAFAAFPGLSTNQAQASYRATALDALWRRSSPWANLGRTDPALAVEFLESPVAWGALLQAPAAKIEILRGRALRLPTSWLEDLGGDEQAQARHCVQWAWGLSQAAILGCGRGEALRAQSVELFIELVRQCDLRFQTAMQRWKASEDVQTVASETSSISPQWVVLNEQYAWVVAPLLLLANEPQLAWGRHLKNAAELTQVSDPSLLQWAQERVDWLLNEASPEEWLLDRMQRCNWLQSSPLIDESVAQNACQHWVRRFEQSAKKDPQRWSSWDQLCARWMDEGGAHWREFAVEERWMPDFSTWVLGWIEMGLNHQAPMEACRTLIHNMFPPAKRASIERFDPAILLPLEAGWERDELRRGLLTGAQEKSMALDSSESEPNRHRRVGRRL